jgi:hypothetical protein
MRRRLVLATVLTALVIPVAANAATWSPVTGSTDALQGVTTVRSPNGVLLTADQAYGSPTMAAATLPDGSHIFARRYGPQGAEPVIDLGAPGGSVQGLDGSVAPNGDPEALAVVTQSDGTTATYYARGPQTGSVPPPVLGKAVDAAVISGTVLIKLPLGSQASDALAKRHGFVRLSTPRQLPVGTQVDARAGKLKLVAATGKQGKTQTGTFGGALFDVGQNRSGIQKGLTTLSLIDDAFPGAPSFKICTGKAAALTGHIASKHPSKQVLQTLRASDNHGSFRTRGRFSAGTVRGTVWGTIDRCDGTVTWVSRGSVRVSDFGLRKTVIVHAGQRYLARART